MANAPILIDLDFNRNQLLNVVIHKQSSAPSTPTAGQLWYDNSVANVLKYYDGTAWQVHANQAWVTALRLDQFAAPTIAVSLNGQKITNLLDPTAAQDAATKTYVDQLINGTDWKASVRALANTNVTLSGLQTIDGVSLAVGERVAVVGQTTASQNGLYNAASGAWTRTSDANNNGKVTPNLAFFVEEGTTYSDSQWRLTTNAPIVLDTTSLAFSQFGSGTSYTAGNGIAIVGSVISIDPAIGVRKATAVIGDGTATSFVITHNLANQYPASITVYRVSDGRVVMVEANGDATNACTLNFNAAPTIGQYRVVVSA